MFPLPGGPLRGRAGGFRPGSVPVSPCPLRRRSVFTAPTFQRRWPDNLAIIECRSVPRPCGSGPRRLSSSAEASNEPWSPGDRQSLMSSSSRPDRGPGGHSCGSEPQALVRLFTPSQDPVRAVTPVRGSGRACALPGPIRVLTPVWGSGRAFAFPVQSGCYTRLEFRSNFRPSGVLTNLSICKPAVRLRFRPGRSGCPGDRHECTRRSHSGQMRSLPSFRAIAVLFADPLDRFSRCQRRSNPKTGFAQFTLLLLGTGDWGLGTT